MSQSNSPDELRHGAATAAAELIDHLDDAVLEQHQAAVAELVKLGLLIGRAGVPPYVVLGQMQQAVAVAFCDGIMPRYHLVPKDGG